MKEYSAADDDEPPACGDPFDGPEWHDDGVAESVSPTDRADSARVKISRRKKRLLRRRRRIGVGMLVLGGLVVVAAGWVVITGLMARQQLNYVRSDVRALRADITAGDLSDASARAKQLAQHAHRAHELTSGPIWMLAAAIPAGGEPLHTIRGVTAAVDTLGADALPQLIDASNGLDPAKLRQPNGTIDLEPLVKAAGPLDRASIALTAATKSVQGLPNSTWLSAIDHGRRDVLAQLTSLARTVHSADLAAQIAPAMLGQDGPRSYFLAFQTEAELRGTGGLPGAFAIVQANHGKLRFTHFESDSTLGAVGSGLNFGPAYDQLYAGSNAPGQYADSNASPHFPYAARIWTAMWQKYSGQHLDGAIATDPTALSYLLQVTGPATLPDKSQVSAANVVALTQQTVYAKYPANAAAAQRKQYQLQIARAISQHLLTSNANSTSLVRAAGRAAGERRLMVWSTDPAVETALMQTALSGAVAQTSGPYTGLAINNAAATKLDYYLEASLTWKRTGCGPTRQVTATVTLHNDSPARVPEYVLGQTGEPHRPKHAGDNEILVGYYATQGAQLTGIDLDGIASTAAIGSELGHPVYTVDLPIARGQTRTIVLHLAEPAGKGAPLVLSQPLVRPLSVTIEDAKCG